MFTHINTIHPQSSQHTVGFHLLSYQANEQLGSMAIKETTQEHRGYLDFLSQATLCIKHTINQLIKHNHTQLLDMNKTSMGNQNEMVEGKTSMH